MRSVEALFPAMSALTPWLSRIAALVIVVIILGLMPDIAGIDPSQTILRARAGQSQLMTPEALAAVRADLQLDRTASERLWDWASHALQGDLGRSWIDNSPVAEGLLHAMSTSLLLMSSTLALTFVLCGLAVLQRMLVWRKGSNTANHNSLSTVLISLPEYVVATVLILVFAVWFGWFPPYGWQGLENIWLPSLALALPATGLFSRLLGDSLRRVLKEPWVITWLSANVAPSLIIRGALKKAISSLIPQITMIIIGLTGGAVAVEQIFSIPGVGRLILGATKAQDLPMLQGGLLILLTISIAISCTGLFIQQLILGKSLKAGKLISSPSSFRFTQSKIKRNTGIGILVCLIGIVIWSTFRDPYLSQFSRLAAPSLAAPIGGDGLGRDLLARLGAGMISTFQGGILATALSLLVGLVMGFFARYTQGFIEVTKAIPYIIAGLLIAGLFGMTPYSALIAIVLVSWAPLAAHCSSLIMEAKAQPYTHLAPVWGASQWRVLRHYLLPYILPPLLRHALLRLPVTTLSLTALSFIGLGAKPPAPEWGLMIAENLPYIERAPLGVLSPIFGLVLFGVAINLLFDD